MTLLKLENISKSFGEKRILSNINLELEKSKTICIIGPSGSGKTTLLRCIALLDMPEKGSIKINNKLIIKNNYLTDLKYLRKNVSLVFQGYNLWPHRTALENVTDGLIIVKKISAKKAKVIGKKVLTDLGLEDKIGKYSFSLSGGEKQRVAIARALVMNPSIMLFDEITSALDVESVKKILKIIQKLTKRKMGIIIVTHELGFAKKIADKIIFLDKGRIIKIGNPKEVLESPKNKRIKKFLSNYK